MIQKYKQSTGESCLATDLLQLVGKKITREVELDLLFNALKLDRNNYVLSHLDYVVKKFGLKFNFFIDNKYFYEFVSSCNKSKDVIISQHKIDLKFVDNRLKISPLIIYVDTFPFWKINHSSHFIIIVNKTKSGYKIYDPWDGKVKVVSSKILSKGVINLRNLIKNSPVIIQKIENK